MLGPLERLEPLAGEPGIPVRIRLQSVRSTGIYIASELYSPEPILSMRERVHAA